MTRILSMVRNYLAELCYHYDRMVKWALWRQHVHTDHERRFGEHMIMIAREFIADTHRRAMNKLTVPARRIYFERIENEHHTLKPYITYWADLPKVGGAV